jgi:subfamily B ATP-binding cassette protein HlyB/CyaB
MLAVHRISLRPEDLVWLLGSLCQIHRVPWESALALQRFPPPHSLATLLEAGPNYGFRFSVVPVSKIDWRRVAFPLVAFKRSMDPVDPREEKSAAAAPVPKPTLLLRADAERLLYFECGRQEPATISQRDFEETFEPLLLLTARDTKSTVPAEDGAEPSERRFGFKWFAAELLKHKRVWRDVLLASAAIQLVGLAAPLFTQVIIDKVVVHHTHSTLVVIALGLAMFMLFGAGMTWLRQYLVLHTGNRVDAVLGSHVFWHLLRLPLPYFERRPTGTLVARLAAVEAVRDFLSGATVCLVLDLPFLAIFLAVMFWYSAQLSLIALGVLALIATASALITPILRARINDQFLLGARNQALVTEYVAGIETVKALQMEPNLRARYDDCLAAYLAASFSTRQLSNTFNVIANLLEQAMTLAILCVGALLVMQNPGFTIGMLVAFQMFASRVAQPMLRLAGLWQEFQQASISVKRLGDIMNVPAEPHALTPSRAPNAAGRVEIENLSFRHSPDHPYLYRAFDFAFGSGRLTVLTGPSGSGKSTLAKLLLGFYSPSDGQIRIDGHDIGHLSANELRQYFGVVPQETVLFSGTLYENLAAANPHASFGDVVHACKIAEIHETIERLPGGYNTVIGEHGVGLSGGQKQRLAIARAILKRPRILIFDEATASLDQPTAERFAQTVNRLKGEVTILFIAHQVPRGLHVDEIVSLGGDRPIQMRVESPVNPLAGRG